MDPKLESFNINCSADEVAEYIDRFTFWIDTRGTSDEKAIKGAFLTAVGKDVFPFYELWSTPKPEGTPQSQKFKEHFCDMSDQPSLSWLNG